MPLTTIKIKNIKLLNGKSSRKSSDGGGLYIFVSKTSKLWRLKYRFNGVEQGMSFGPWPDVSLAAARVLRDEARKMLRDGVNPSRIKAARKATAKMLATENKNQQDIDDNTFEVVALLWMATRASHIAKSTAKKNKRRLESYVFPAVGAMPIVGVKRDILAKLILKLSNQRSVETAKRTGTLCNSILKHAYNLGLIDSVPYIDLQNLLPAIETKHMPAIIEPNEIGELLRAIDRYSFDFTHANIVTCYALKILPYLFVRAGEFRGACWSEIDFDAAKWTIPSHARKLIKRKKEDVSNVHIVPLSFQATALLRELQSHTGDGKHLFPSIRGDSRPMSENTINNAIARMGFKDRMVGHGWRSVFSTIMNKHKFNRDSIEQQLAHTEKDAVRAAYARSDYMIEDRVTMMQTWANYLDSLRSGECSVVPIMR